MTEGGPPSGLLALGFAEPTSIGFLTFAKDLDDDWPQQLHDDRLGPFTITYGRFGFNDENLTSELLRQAVRVIQFHGVAVGAKRVRRARFRLSFAAQGVGLIVAADCMALANAHGPVQPGQVQGMSTAWWDYWKEYWRLRDTDAPMPKDYACEATIPLQRYRYRPFGDA
jgi:hypothetical protein